MMAKLARREHIFGIAPCLAALHAGRRRIYKIFLNEKLQKEDPQRESLCEVIEEAESRGINVKYKARSVLDKVAGNRPHQNVVMLAGTLSCEAFVGDLSDGNHNSFYMALHQIQDPMNFGAIIRSATYFGVDKIIVTSKDCCGLTPTVSKASSGAMEWTPIYAVNSMEKFLKKSLNSDWDVIGTVGNNVESHAPVFGCEDVELKKSSILVFGNEGFGLSSNILEFCTKMVTIQSPNQSLPRGLDSLNVSVATGILLHSLINNRLRYTNT